MFSTSMKSIYPRILILGFFSSCLFIFGYSEEPESVQAALLCAQDCDRYFEMCNDSCQGQCGDTSTDEDCTGCLHDCSDEWNSCLSRATYCSNGGTVSYDPQCGVEFGTHCPIVNGAPNCNPSAGAHSGYFEACSRIGYENGCIVCPAGEFCTSPTTSGLPHCL